MIYGRVENNANVCYNATDCISNERKKNNGSTRVVAIVVPVLVVLILILVAVALLVCKFRKPKDKGKYSNKKHSNSICNIFAVQILPIHSSYMIIYCGFYISMNLKPQLKKNQDKNPFVLLVPQDLGSPITWKLIVSK